MGTTYRFISDPGRPLEVLAWFAQLPEPPDAIETDEGTTLYFRYIGGLSRKSDGTIDSTASPIATVFPPRVKRGVLWTVGEVHFLATPLKQRFPALHRVSSSFSRWLATHECVFSNARKDNEFAYYLEGSIQHYNPPVFAFEAGLAALRRGQYFVDMGDIDSRLDQICGYLRLRGVAPLDA